MDISQTLFLLYSTVLNTEKVHIQDTELSSYLPLIFVTRYLNGYTEYSKILSTLMMMIEMCGMGRIQQKLMTNLLGVEINCFPGLPQFTFGVPKTFINTEVLLQLFFV